MIASYEVIRGAPDTNRGPVGNCIYCGATVYWERDPTRKLGDEHVIPLNILGNLVLRESSCHGCERITSDLETHCADSILRAARPHLGIVGRKSGKVRQKIAVGVEGTNRQIHVPLADHPGHLFTFRFDVMPRILLGMPKTTSFGGKIVITPLVPDMGERVRRLQARIGAKIQIGWKMDAAIFARMLAKVAHAYAVTEIGYKGFRSLLMPLILGSASPEDLSYYVGGWGEDLPATTALHQIFLDVERAESGQQFLVARMRFFSDREEVPGYRVVVGES